MKYRKLGNSELDISVIGLGTWAIGADYWGKVEDRESIRAVQAAVDAGISLIDTAPAYGQDHHAEEVIGKAIKGRRDQVVLATKVGTIRHPDRFERNLKPDSIRMQLETSLRKLGTDVIDLYQIHWPDPGTPLEESLEALIKEQQAGKFRYLGVSNFDTELMDRARGMAEIVSLQPPYSLLKREIEEDILPYCRKNNLGVLGYGSLAGGILTGKFREIPEFDENDNRKKFYPYFTEALWPKLQEFLDVLRNIAGDHGRPVAHTALNWTVQQQGITCALVGAKNAGQAKANAAAADWELSTDELNRIEEAYEQFIEA